MIRGSMPFNAMLTRTLMGERKRRIEAIEKKLGITQEQAEEIIRKRRTLKNMWVGFAEQAIPPGASEIQVREMKRSFYAGAASFKDLIMVCFDPGDEEPTEADMDYFGSLADEIDDFVIDLAEGNA